MERMQVVSVVADPTLIRGVRVPVVVVNALSKFTK